jgi:ABC-type phosphate transport system permease subunit
MLAFARVAGETAPLLFTALGNEFWSTSAEPADCRAAAADLRLCAFARTTIGIGWPGPDRWF